MPSLPILPPLLPPHHPLFLPPLFRTPACACCRGEASILEEVLERQAVHDNEAISLALQMALSRRDTVMMEMLAA